MTIAIQVFWEFCYGLVGLLTRDADGVTANRLVMPSPLVNLSPPNQQDSNFTFNLNTLESGTAPDEWMIMDSHGTWW